MGMRSLFTGIFIISSMYLLVINQFQNALAAPSNANPSLETHVRTRGRPLARFAARQAAQYARMKSEPFNDFIDDDDLFELSKRQTSDDYGHLRFGKRGEEQFDDYGHMRFGRSGGEK